MKRYSALFFSAFTLVIICFSACTNPTTIGADLLESDRQNVKFSEDFVMQTSTIKGDSVITFSPASQLTDYLVGEYQDPVFGKVRSSVYAQLSTGAGRPNFVGQKLDSIVLVLPYKTTQEYGNVNTEYTIDILRIDEADRFGESDNPYANVLWSDETFVTESTPIASKTFVPNTTDDVIILSPDGEGLESSLDTLVSQLRIPLEDDFALELFNADTNMPEDSVFFTDDKFTAFFNGIHINPTSENEGLLDFGLRNNSDAGMFVYYTIRSVVDNSDSISTSYQFAFAASDLKVSNYEHDYTGSIVESFVNDSNSGDSLFFLQGMAGVDGTLKFPNLDNLREDVAINKAELIFTVADLPEDLDIYELPAEIFLTEIDENGDFQIIEGVFSASSAAAINTTVFGGTLTEYTDDRPGTYSMNITAHLQNILNGKATDELAVLLFGRGQSPNRAVFYGGGHSTYPVQLRVHYTQF